MPNLNSGTPWSELADRDLRWCFERDWALEVIVDFLRRDVEEVVQRIRTSGCWDYRRTSAGSVVRIVESRSNRNMGSCLGQGRPFLGNGEAPGGVTRVDPGGSPVQSSKQRAL